MGVVDFPVRVDVSKLSPAEGAGWEDDVDWKEICWDGVETGAGKVSREVSHTLEALSRAV